MNPIEKMAKLLEEIRDDANSTLTSDQWLRCEVYDIAVEALTTYEEWKKTHVVVDEERLDVVLGLFDINSEKEMCEACPTRCISVNECSQDMKAYLTGGDGE